MENVENGIRIGSMRRMSSVECRARDPHINAGGWGGGRTEMNVQKVYYNLSMDGESRVENRVEEEEWENASVPVRQSSSASTFHHTSSHLFFHMMIHFPSALFAPVVPPVAAVPFVDGYRPGCILFSISSKHISNTKATFEFDLAEVSIQARL